MREVLVGLQAATFVGLGALFLTSGEWRLGAAQVALAFVTVVVYV